MNTDALIDVIILVIKIIAFIGFIYITIDMNENYHYDWSDYKKENIIYLIIWQINFFKKFICQFKNHINSY